MRALLVVLTVGCAATASTPTPQNVERDTASVESPPDPATPDGATFEAQPTRFTIVDVDTGRPIPDAVMNVDGADVISDASGIVDVMLPFEVARSAIVRHPKYLPFKGPITEQPMTIALQARSAKTYATITATGAAQSVRVGNVTMTIPRGALPAGTHLELGLHDARTIPQPEYPTEPAREMVPIPIAQLSVDVIGHDGRRFAHVVTPGSPIRLKWKLDADTFLRYALLGPAATLSAGTSAEHLGVDALTLDANTYEVSFDVTHFSDVTLTQKFDITRGCNGEPVALHWWRVERKAPYGETRNPTPGVVGCAEHERPLSITASETETMNAQGSFATNWKVGAKADVGASAGLTGKIMGNGVDQSWGPTFGWVYDYTRTHTGGFSVQASRKITVTRSKMCPARTSCVGGLYIVMEDEEVNVLHKWVLFADLAKDPAFDTKPFIKINISGKQCGSTINSKDFFTAGAGLGQMIGAVEPKGATPLDAAGFTKMATDLGKQLESDPNYQIPNQDLLRHVQSEAFSWSTRKFKGAYMAIKMVPPTCPPGHGEPVEIPPITQASCLVPHARLPPAVVTPARQDSLVDKEGTVVFDKTVTVAETSLHVTITAGNTEASPLQEVAHATACCSDEEAKVTFASDVLATISGGQQGAHSTGIAIGAKGSAGYDIGLDIGLAEAKFKGKFDAAFQTNLTQAWINMIQEGFGRGRGSSKDVTAKATKTDCASKGLFAYLYRTEYTIKTEIRGAVFDSDKTLTAVVQFYGTALEGQDTVFKNHCDSGGTHVPSETPPTDVPVPPADPKKPNDKHVSVPVPTDHYCAAVGLGQLGGLGDSYGAGEVALYANGCLKITDQLAAVVTPTWYHGPANETFTFAAGGEATMGLGEQAPHVSLFARLQAGYAHSTAFPGAMTGTNAAVIVPEAGARYIAGRRFVGITPLSLPVFIGSQTSAYYQLSITAGTTL
jgi:hypothetical protein